MAETNAQRDARLEKERAAAQEKFNVDRAAQEKTNQDEPTKPPLLDDDGEQFIVHRTNYVDEHGVPQIKEHRVKLSEWPAYEKEHNL